MKNLLIGIPLTCSIVFASCTSFAATMRVDLGGVITKRSSAYTGPLDVSIGDAFSLTAFFDLTTPPAVTSTPERSTFYNIGTSMTAQLGSYTIVSGTPQSPVPASLQNTYANASVVDYVAPGTNTGLGFNFSATSANTLNGFSPYYVAISAFDYDKTAITSLDWAPSLFSAATLAAMEQTKVDFSLHDGGPWNVLRFEGEISNWQARIVSTVPLPASGLLLIAGVYGLGLLSRNRRTSKFAGD